MLAPCHFQLGKSDSLSPRILSQRWLGLMTLGGIKSLVGQVKQVMLITRAVTE